MDNSDELKDLKKRQLDIEMEQEVQEAEEKLLEAGLQSSGKREVGLVVAKYKNLKDQIDAGGVFEVFPQVNTDGISNIPDIKTSLLGSRQPFLPERNKKYKKLRGLQNLFIRLEAAPFPLIAKEIGLNKTLGEYRPSQRSTICNLQKRFNLKIKKSWDMMLSSKDNVSGLRLIRTTNS